MSKMNFASGDVFRIDIEEGGYAYGRVVRGALINFYNFRSDRPASLQEVVSKPVLFQVPVMNRAAKRWRVIGNVPLSLADATIKPRFMQDILDPTILKIYENGNVRAATRAECEGLEREAVWDPEHIEDRLSDYFSGKPNKWVDSLKLR